MEINSDLKQKEANKMVLIITRAIALILIIFVLILAFIAYSVLKK